MNRFFRSIRRFFRNRRNRVATATVAISLVPLVAANNPDLQAALEQIIQMVILQGQ